MSIINVKRNVKTQRITDDILAYRDSVYIEGSDKEHSSTQGIAPAEKIKAVKKLIPIKTDEFYGLVKSSDLKLYKDKEIEFNNLWERREKKPYDLILNYGSKGYKLCAFDHEREEVHILD